MAILGKKTVVMKDGRSCTVRSAEPSDAKGVIKFKFHIAETSKYLTLQPHEIKDTRWKTRSHLKQVLANPDAMHILALVDGEIIGYINTFNQTRMSLRHNIEFGIAISPSWQGAGLGYILLNELLNWAKANETITRVELHVHSQNKGAIALYEKLGFEKEGHRRNSIKYSDGTYVDDFIMAQLF
jgi:RimJ/RimL family protein N-acetyltransferase